MKHISLASSMCITSLIVTSGYIYNIYMHASRFSPLARSNSLGYPPCPAGNVTWP
ncbi:hypothetical protein BDV09DRAFT_160454 [Aspergillus tetrazonus]